MIQKLKYFLRLFCPDKLYAYSTKVRIPQSRVDFRKFLSAKFILGESGSAIDGGAHIGYYTRYFSEIIRLKGRVYSFEPNPYMFKLLNKYAYGSPNVVACQKALSNRNGRASFHVEPFSLSQDSTLGAQRPGHKKINVETVCLDDFVDKSEDIRLIKLDVEGHELEAVLGAEELIHRCRPWIIFEYVKNEKRNDQEILRRLSNWEYRCKDLDTLDWLPHGGNIELTDVLAIPQEDEESARRFLDSLGCFIS